MRHSFSFIEVLKSFMKLSPVQCMQKCEEERKATHPSFTILVKGICSIRTLNISLEILIVNKDWKNM